MCDEKVLGPTLGRCGHLVRERMDARLTEYDVTPAQVHVLNCLSLSGGGMPQCGVTAHLRVKPSTVNGILDRMEEKGLLCRTVSDTDARQRKVTLTEKGSALQEICRQVFLETESLMVRGLSDGETELLFSLLERVIANLEEDRSL